MPRKPEKLEELAEDTEENTSEKDSGKDSVNGDSQEEDLDAEDTEEEVNS
jgi:hypothetical protein